MAPTTPQISVLDPIHEGLSFCIFCVFSEGDDDDGGDGGGGRILGQGQPTNPTRPGIKYPVRETPHFDKHPGLADRSDGFPGYSVFFVVVRVHLFLGAERHLSGFRALFLLKSTYPELQISIMDPTHRYF